MTILDDESNRDLVTRLYAEILLREPDREGLAGHVRLLNMGRITPQQLEESMRNSIEFRELVRPKATHRLRFTGTCDEREFASKCREHDFWYHSFYFDNGFVQRGDYNIGLDIGEYGFPADMSDLTVLDVGTGSGWFATYFEQLGAQVTTVDARGYCDFDVRGRPGYPDVALEKPVPDRVLADGRPIYYSPVSKGFWIMKDILGLTAEYVNARVYEIRPELFQGKTFDLVFMGAVLMHLRDPIGALMALRSVCKHRLIANAIPLRALEDVPVMQMLKGDSITWWAPNESCLVEWFKAAGFTRIEPVSVVHLTVDKPFVDEHGHSSAVTQDVALVNAWV